MKTCCGFAMNTINYKLTTVNILSESLSNELIQHNSIKHNTKELS